MQQKNPNILLMDSHNNKMVTMLTENINYCMTLTNF